MAIGEDEAAERFGQGAQLARPRHRQRHRARRLAGLGTADAEAGRADGGRAGRFRRVQPVDARAGRYRGTGAASARGGCADRAGAGVLRSGSASQVVSTFAYLLQTS